MGDRVTQSGSLDPRPPSPKLLKRMSTLIISLTSREFLIFQSVKQRLRKMRILLKKMEEVRLSRTRRKRIKFSLILHLETKSTVSL